MRAEAEPELVLELVMQAKGVFTNWPLSGPIQNPPGMQPSQCGLLRQNRLSCLAGGFYVFLTSDSCLVLLISFAILYKIVSAYCDIGITKDSIDTSFTKPINFWKYPINFLHFTCLNLYNMPLSTRVGT